MLSSAGEEVGADLARPAPAPSDWRGPGSGQPPLEEHSSEIAFLWPWTQIS